MIAHAAGTHRYRVLDAWRGICALLVAFFHIPVAHGWQTASAFYNLQLFVDFFFVLSGFVICHAYGQRLQTDRDFAGFMIRRFGRVWPLHAAIIAAFFVLEVLKVAAGSFMPLPLDGAPFTNNHTWITLLSNLLMTQAFNLHGMTSWNDPAWSIGVEFYTYAVFAAVILTVGRRNSAFGLMAALGLAGVVAFSSTWLLTTHDFGFFRCVYGFFIGCLVYDFSRTPFAERLSGTAAEIVSIVALMLFIAATGKNASSLAAPLMFAVIVAVFATERGAVSRALLSAPAQALGLWSYSIYMVHMLVISVLKIALTVTAKVGHTGLKATAVEPTKLWSFGNAFADASLIAVYLGLVLLLARFTYAHIEAPARNWFAKLADDLRDRRSVTAMRALS